MSATVDVGGGSSTATASQQSSSYFADFKKGEVNELMNLLVEASATRDDPRQREVFTNSISHHNTVTNA